jgi:hypothetical protein
VVAFGIGPRLAAERDTHAALRLSRDRRLESQWDFGSRAMGARIFRPLVWFGLLEARSEGKSPTEVVDRRLYRKAPLFDRFLKFDVQVEGPEIRH